MLKAEFVTLISLKVPSGPQLGQRWKQRKTNAGPPPSPPPHVASCLRHPVEVLLRQAPQDEVDVVPLQVEEGGQALRQRLAQKPEGEREKKREEWW